jgi:hypothetical protein
MKINTQIVLKDLAGKDIKISEEGFTFGNALSNIIIASKEGGKMKLYVLATKLYKDKVVEVDEADLNLIKSSVKSSEVYNALVLGQCEVLLEEVK